MLWETYFTIPSWYSEVVEVSVGNDDGDNTINACSQMFYKNNPMYLGIKGKLSWCMSFMDTYWQYMDIP